MKTLLCIICFNTLAFSNYAYSYSDQKGKIDMHGGKSEKINTNGSFSNSFSLGSKLNKQEDEEKNFLKIDNIEKIKKEENSKNE